MTSPIDERRAALRHAMERVAGGDSTALKVVYDMTNAKLFGIVVRIVNDQDRACEVLQEVYLKVWRRAGLYDPEIGSPISWLAIIARNSAIDEMRKRGRPEHESDEGLDTLADDAIPVDELLCDAELHAAVRECLDRLEGEQKRTIRLAFFGGFSHSQLASRIGVPLGTLKSRIRRGLAALKGCLGYAGA